MIRPLVTYDNIPWNNAQAINFQGTLTGTWSLGRYRFNLDNRVDLIPSERAQYGALYLFDSWSLGATITQDDWQKSIEGVGRASVYSEQGESLFKAPLPVLIQSSWYPLKQAWLPAQSPSRLKLAFDASFRGTDMAGYTNPSISFSLMAYEITDKAFIDAFTDGWKAISDANDPAAHLDPNSPFYKGQTAVVVDGTPMRTFR